VTGGLTLDAGALIAVDRDDRRVLTLLARSKQARTRVTIPATALSQVVRDLRRQTRLAQLLKQQTTDVVPLDAADAIDTGRLLAMTGNTDIVDAHVVVCALRAGQAIVTSDPDDLRALNPGATLIAI
jgi:predicted nucleic acid-binding protein